MVGVASLVSLSSFGQSSPTARQDARKECIASLSGFPADAGLHPPPYPADLNGITMEYTESGCYGSCPAFTLTIIKEGARFDGHAYVRAKGKHTAKLSGEQFAAFLRAWFDGNFFAMRDDYCSVTCSDGTVIIVTDIAESSLKVTTPTFTKRVFQCFSTVSNQPQTPRPPEQYFELSRQLLSFVKSQHWL
jgi:Domain of unknown function (DUF6438)